MSTAQAMVLEAFGQPLVWRKLPLVAPGPGEVQVQIEAAGVCGSDLHIWAGEDQRVHLPTILGHEGVGRILAIGGERLDAEGHPLRPGDRVAWDRGVTCGTCYWCTIRQQPYVCPERKTYGISYSCNKPPYFLGCYSEVIHLFASTRLLKVPDDIDPALIAIVGCSGAMAVHATEEAQIQPGANVVVVGSGPLGLFAVAFARRRGAGQIIISGTARSANRLAIAQGLGATAEIISDQMTPAERLDAVRALTGGRGADVVIECAGTPQAIADGAEFLAPGGVYALAGAAVPGNPLPVRIFESVVRKNARWQGVWAGDTKHLYQAIRWVLEEPGRYAPLITHRFPLAQANQALAAVGSRQAVKAVMEPVSVDRSSLP